MRKKIARITEAQNCMTEALSHGNLNQVGRSVWGSMIDLVQEMLVDEINNAIVEFDNEKANDLDKRLKELQTQMQNYRDEQGLGPDDSDDRLAVEDKCYGQMKTAEGKLKESLELAVNKHPFPQLCNHSVPKYMYTEMYNNRWDLCHGYITTDLTSKQMETFYETAAEDGKNEDVNIDHDKCKHRKEAMCTISEAFDHPCYYMCSRKLGHTCPLPNQKKMPNIVVAILPEDPTEYLKIPVFVWEVIGKKEIKEKGKREFAGFVTALQCLSTGPYCYYGEVDGDTVKLYHFQKIVDEGQIHITVEKFTYATKVPGGMSLQFGKIIERLKDIFVDIFVNLSWIKHECSRLMKSAKYRNFIAAQGGRHDRGIEMHCWHIFEPRYFCQHKIEDPVEYIKGVDKCNPCIPDAKKEGVPENTYAVSGDELVLVLLSDTLNSAIKDIHKKVEQTSHMEKTVLALERSQAVRDPNTGSRANHFSDDNWNKAFIQFWVNISLHVEKKVPNFVGILQHHQFDVMFNPTIKQPLPTQRKDILCGQANEDIAADYNLDTDDEDDIDVVEFAPLFGMHSLVKPQRMIPGPPHGVPG